MVADAGELTVSIDGGELGLSVERCVGKDEKPLEKQLVVRRGGR